MGDFIKRTLFGFVDLVGLILVGAFAATFFAERHWSMEMLTNFQVYYFIGGIVFLLFNLVFFRKIQLALAIIFTAVVTMPLVPYYEPDTSLSKSGKVYKACLINLYFDASEKNVGAVADYVRKENPDILLFQDVDPRWHDSLKATLDPFPHEIDSPREKEFGFWLLSKYPLNGPTFVPDKSAANPFIVTVVPLEGGVFQFIGAQTTASKITPWTAKLRRDELHTLAGYVQLAGDRPTMVLGNINTTPWSPYFKKFLAETSLYDTAKSHGVQATWAPRLPFLYLPTSHALVSKNIITIDRYTGPNIGADHLPVVVKFAFQ